jgi:AraC family transcriptional regulator
MPNGGLTSLQGYRMQPTAFLPELPNSRVSLLRFTREEKTPSHLIEHRIHSYTLSLILRPMRSRGWYGGKQIWSGAIAANTIHLTPPEIETSWQSDGAFDFLLFTFPTSIVETITGSSGAEIHEQLARTYPLYIRDDVVPQIARYMLAACESSRRNRLHFADGLGSALVAHLFDQYLTSSDQCRPNLSPTSLRRVTRHIAEHLGDDIAVRDLATIAGLSESHFAHAFRASAGEPPHHFITTMRLEKGRALLLESNRSISDIALECGYRDATHFGRAFHQRVGISPRQFRRSN